MNIALFGYGKMGQLIEKLAVKRGHKIVARIDENSDETDFSSIDIAIDFSVPESAFKNITDCFDHGVPVVSGTTGWLHRFDEAVEKCNKQGGAFIYASNFSLGVNLFFDLNAKLAQIMKSNGQYKVSLEEIHHTRKLDAPSGTAITLAESIVANSDYKTWKLEGAAEDDIPIVAKRIGDTPGTHTVKYDSEIDSIEIKHTAHNRNGFALGAIVAAEWLLGKKGVFTMKDVLNLH